MKFFKTLILIWIISWLAKKLVRRLSIVNNKHYRALKIMAITLIADKIINGSK